MSFRFEGLLKIKKGQVHQAHKSVSYFNNQLLFHRASLELSGNTENKYKQSFDLRLKEDMDIKARKIFDKYLDQQKRKRDIKIAAIEQIANQLEIKKNELISAIKKEKSLKIIRFKALKTFKKNAMIIENNGYEEDLTFWRGQFS
ncbi:MAG: hypothetical protein ACQ9MH_12715 [Nitrospinales bacterium]